MFRFQTLSKTEAIFPMVSLVNSSTNGTLEIHCSHMRAIYEHRSSRVAFWHGLKTPAKLPESAWYKKAVAACNNAFNKIVFNDRFGVYLPRRLSGWTGNRWPTPCRYGLLLSM
jgi:hypothetical protein